MSSRLPYSYSPEHRLSQVYLKGQLSFEMVHFFLALIEVQ